MVNTCGKGWAVAVEQAERRNNKLGNVIVCCVCALPAYQQSTDQCHVYLVCGGQGWVQYWHYSHIFHIQ